MNDDLAGADIRVICGPTAAGKSAIAMWLAERGGRGSVIISADSRQVYRGFDIGTAKPTLDERARVPHLGIDVVDPTQRFSAAAWADAASHWIDEARAAGRPVIVVGGTGLYLRALFEGLFHEPPLDDARRRTLELVLSELSIHELRGWARVLDPSRAHLGRTQLLRSIEIGLLTGHRLSDLHRDRAATPRWRPRYLVVDPGHALAERLGARLDDMLDHGWPEEVRTLMQTLPPDAPAWNATGYNLVRRMNRGELSRVAAHEAILVQTRQYAKRQRTWFRHQLPDALVTRVDPLAAEWRDVVDRWSIGSLRGETTA